MSADPPLPWSLPIRLGEIQRAPRTVELSADPAVRARIARWLDLPGLTRFEASVDLSPWLDGARIRARWRAELQQTCSVTAEPFDVAPGGEWELRVVPAESRAAPAADAEIALDPEAEDPPDVLEGDEVDVAAYLVEHLGLALDPFPRAPGAAFDPPEPEAEPSPFAALAALRRPD